MIATPYVVYIASNSASRKALLQVACIPFHVIHQDADESTVSTNQQLHEIVMQLAQLKMQHAQIPNGTIEGQLCFVLTADTLSKTSHGRILTKPADRNDAIAMLAEARAGALTATGFCIRKMEWKQGGWHVMQEIVDYDKAECVFDVPADFIDFYLDAIPFLNVSGGISIEGVGGQFLRNVHGNYETIVGLPMFKIRQALEKLRFYNE